MASAIVAQMELGPVKYAVKIRVRQARKRAATLLFDPERSLEQRTLDEQFEL